MQPVQADAILPIHVKLTNCFELTSPPMKTSAPEQPASSSSRNSPAWQYSLALTLIPIVLIVLLEGGLRQFDYGQNLALFIPATEGFPDHLMNNPSVSLRYFRREDHPPTPHRDQFFRHKPNNGYRIFLIGESTATGWPYHANMMPSRILARRLSEAFPDKQIEVVSVGVTAINSYAFLDFANEILEQSPDAILIYGGHNEFYGALGVGSSKSVGNRRWLVKSYLALQRFKSFLLLKDAINAAQNWVTPGSDEASLDTLMLKMVKDKNIPQGSAVRQQGIDQFRNNMGDLLGKFKKAGVPVIISEQVSNLRDQPPFVSVADNGHQSALDIYHQAQQLEQAGRIDAARSAYIRAKELDALPFRAPEQINQTIHQLAKEYGIPVVPMQRYFEQASHNGIIGSQLMMEHLHPTAEGYFLLSEAFLETMRQSRMISAQWPHSTLSRDYREHWGFTEFDEVLARLRIIELTASWPFKPLAFSGQTFASFQPRSSLEAHALKMLYYDTDIIDAHGQLATEKQQQGDIDGALREYRAMIEISPYDLELYRSAASLALNNERPDDALPLLLRAIRMQPIAEASKWIGQIYLQRNDLPQAAHYLDQARAWDKEGDAQLPLLLKDVHMRMQEHDNLAPKKIPRSRKS